MTNDVVVIGGGIAGLSTAYRVARDGHGVTVVDAAHEGQATAAGAGILSHGALRDLPPHHVGLFRSATAYYRHLVELLAADGEDDLGHGVVGELIVAPGPGGDERLAQMAVRLAEENERWQGRPIGEVELLSPHEARRLFPPLADGLAAVHTTEVGRVDGRLLRDALRRATERHGGHILHGSAVLRPGGPGSPPFVEVGTEMLQAQAVVVAGGAWSPALLSPLGVSLPVSPQRGQIAHVRLPAASTGSYPVLSGHGSDYIVCFPPDRVVLGATREEGTGFDYRVTAGGVAEILARALAVAPGLAPATLEEIRVGFRPASRDGVPILGKVPGQHGLYAATGFGPSGLTLAPYSADLVAALATNGPPYVVAGMSFAEAATAEELLAPFSPGRFGPAATLPGRGD